MSFFQRGEPSTVINGTVKEVPSNAPSQAELLPKVLRDLRDTVKKGGVFNLDTSTVSAVIDALRHVNSIDDRKMLLEHVLVLLSRLPPGAIYSKLQAATVELLYNDLAHPPVTQIGPKYQWRAADGSNNNIQDPDMGKAGTPYARSVQQTHPLPASSLPDAGLVFDTLLKRDGFVKHPAGLSSMMFSFAALVIHSVFRTSHTDVSINETSSYVDLSPLYGVNQEQQDKVRVRNGRGTLLPDVFAEDRLLLLPPAVCVLLVLFNRNHNYIVNKLLEINERGTFVDPDSLSSSDPEKNKKLLAQDEELFQTGRLINCGWFAGVVFSDYLSAILGLVRDGNGWSLDTFSEIRDSDHALFERGRGNVCSVEFNCLYRWHATTSREDEEWVKQLTAKLFPDKAYDNITVMDFAKMARQMQASEPDVGHWTFGGLQRQENGSFNDDQLAKILHDTNEHAAGAFRARGTPPVMRLHEIMGIEANRRWGVCSLNDFRQFLGLKTYTSFKEWNPDPEIYTAAEKLYGHIDHLELYVGLQAEEAKPVIEGAGLCPGYTISRAILSDAIALTRGDRFFTTDCTPFNLTTWGFNDCQRDAQGAGCGSMLGRLFLRTLGNNYTDNSVYTWFPLLTPDAMKTYLTNLGTADKYDFSRPKARSAPRVITSPTEVAHILKSENFEAPYSKRAAAVIKGDGFFVAPAESSRGSGEEREVLRALVPSSAAADKIAAFYYDTTCRLIKESSWTLVGGKIINVNIVRDVLKFVPLHWAATELAGISIKSLTHPHGQYGPQELFDILAEIYEFLFLEVDPAQRLVTQERVHKHINELLHHIKSNLSIGGGQRFSLAGLLDTVTGLFLSNPRKTDREELLHRLSEIGHSSDHLANTILAILVGSTVELSLALTNTVNLFLQEDYCSKLHSLATSQDLKALSQLTGYVWEASRVDPPFRGVYRICKVDQQIAGLSLQKDDHVFLDVAGANMSGQVFSNAGAVDPTRNKDMFLNGTIFVSALGSELTEKIQAQVVRAIFSLENVRRGPGRSGILPRFKDDTDSITRYGYIDQHAKRVPWPTSMTIQWDSTSGANGVH